MLGAGWTAILALVAAYAASVLSTPAGISGAVLLLIGGLLYVTYALQNAQKHDDVSGPGHGFVDVFTPQGGLVERLASRGTLNSPWGLALAAGDSGRSRTSCWLATSATGGSPPSTR